MKKVGLIVSAIIALGLAGCSQPKAPTQQTVEQTGTVTLKKNVKVSLSKAWTTFTTQNAGAAVTGIDLKKAGSGYHYEIEGVDDSTEYELTLDAATGKTVRKTSEALDADEANGVKKAADALTKNGLQTLTEVTDLAEKQVGDGDAYEWSLEKDSGSTVWQVLVRHGKTTTEVTIDAYGGEILKSEVDD
ncbi:PepSY domain-containing protein [Lacticaseibacillus daqingensis]|uniref:PepSY domain-containing protein n=1 Tax=Lacticaseibacillus daqingensis TaxID=2486014 RepID=UPI000F7B7D3B|nr:PepSY domain-containing protein [Lacticaseibacillus daqingensis]